MTIRVTEDPTDRRLQLGRALRAARRAADLTQQEAAEALGCTQGKINKVETTFVRVSRQDLEKLIETYRVDPGKGRELRELAELDRVDAPPRTTANGPWTAFASLIEQEPAAAEILCWHSERIPGPLQSERYMLRQHRPETETQPGVTRLLRQRRARTRISTIENPPHYQVILSESSLHRMPGGRSSELVADQAEHLLALVDRHKQLELQILTFDANVRFVDNDFEILRFADATPAFTYIEYLVGSRLLKREEELKRFQEHWDILGEAALSRSDSMDFLRMLAEMDKQRGDRDRHGKSPYPTGGQSG